jgi:hypothetical protein
MVFDVIMGTFIAVKNNKNRDFVDLLVDLLKPGVLSFVKLLI